jgi:acetyl esterase/lipase
MFRQATIPLIQRCLKTCALLILLTVLPACVKAPALGRPQADGINIIRDIRYRYADEADAFRHCLDMYLPTQGEAWPTVVLVHGGGWIVNDKSIVANVAVALARRDIAVACPNYRLSPRVQQPYHAADAASAVAWVKRNAHRFGADADRLILIGYSSGAQLASLMALDAGYLLRHGMSPDELKGVIVISGAYDFKNTPLIFWPVFTSKPEVWKRVSPIQHIRSGQPPFLILYGENDLSWPGSIEEQSRKFYSALKAKGATARIMRIKDHDHDSIMAHIGKGPSDILEAIVDFIRETVGM